MTSAGDLFPVLRRVVDPLHVFAVVTGVVAMATVGVAVALAIGGVL